jgi:hypothetical protein
MAMVRREESIGPGVGPFDQERTRKWFGYAVGMREALAKAATPAATCCTGTSRPNSSKIVGVWPL